MKTVRLGFEVGTGAEVQIPLKHMVIAGQTQEAGKTTALEGLISRVGVNALTFVTKRGESSFLDAHVTDPYFREQSDWQFVASILEASRGEKLKYERAWIIRASRGTRTLAEVHRNVRAALEKRSSGKDADVYTVLDAYLEVVVPTIARVKWAPRLTLAPGLNVVDLRHLPMEMQHLVIKSSLDWVLEHETDCVVVIPEAWKFIPEGRSTPVKLSASAYIRQGAALRNLLWLDSQDIGVVAKEILRSCPLWILGVQRESNEIKRTLENIPNSIKKPDATALASLGLGEFYACWQQHTHKVYAQPAWLIDSLSEMVAKGSLSADSMRRAAAPERESIVDEQTARELRSDNEALRATVEQQNAQIASLTEQVHRLHAKPEPKNARALTGGIDVRAVPADQPQAVQQWFDADTERIYGQIKWRLIAEAATDPMVLKLLTSRPELVVEVSRKVHTVEGDKVKGRVARLMSKGWFAEPRRTGAVRSELARTGADPGGGGALGLILDGFCKDGFFVRAGEGYQLAPGVKVSERELSVL